MKWPVSVRWQHSLISRFLYSLPFSPHLVPSFKWLNVTMRCHFKPITFTFTKLVFRKCLLFLQFLQCVSLKCLILLKATLASDQSPRPHYTHPNTRSELAGSGRLVLSVLSCNPVTVDFQLNWMELTGGKRLHNSGLLNKYLQFRCKFDSEWKQVLSRCVFTT